MVNNEGGVPGRHRQRWLLLAIAFSCGSLDGSHWAIARGKNCHANILLEHGSPKDVASAIRGLIARI